MAALHTKPKVHPRIAHLQALFASTSMRFDVTDLIEVAAVLHVVLRLAGGDLLLTTGALSVG
jgi:hypothetical protein